MKSKEGLRGGKVVERVLKVAFSPCSFLLYPYHSEWVPVSDQRLDILGIPKAQDLVAIFRLVASPTC